jgi:hypothetical protein
MRTVSTQLASETRRPIRLSLRLYFRIEISGYRTFNNILSNVLDWSSALEWSTVGSSPSIVEFSTRRAVPSSGVTALREFIPEAEREQLESLSPYEIIV